MVNFLPHQKKTRGYATLDGEELHLTPYEYKLLCLLAHNVGKVLTHSYITREIWGAAWEGDVASLRVFMASLRKKIERTPSQPQYIQTHVGVGYRVISIVYSLGAVLGVIGGLLFCSYYQMIYMGIGFAYGTMKAWMASIWGGIGSLKGAIVGAFALGLAETFIGAYVSSAYKDAFVWLIFIIFILIRPQGMFPAQIAEKI